MRFCSILFLVLFCPSVIANDSTLVSKSVRSSMGAFGGFGFNYTEMVSKETFEINIQGGIIYNHWLATGIHLNTFFTLSPLTDKYTSDDANLIGAYGGLFAAPIIYSNALVHASIPVFIGYGNISYELYDISKAANHIEDACQFWVLQPGLEIELNVLKFVRVAVGGYYRICSNIHLNYENGNERIVPLHVLNNFSIGIKLRFGKF